jgi:ferredoxin
MNNEKADLPVDTNAAQKLLSEEQTELASMPDEELVAAYECLRDESDSSGDGPSYPNIRRLYGTALEREKDRRQVRSGAEKSRSEMQEWYEKARSKPCTWWVKNHLVARHALNSCIACGVCTARCPAAQYYEDYNPRIIVDVVLSGDEERLVELLKSEILWYCGQCSSCKPLCPLENNLMGLISSLRFLAQLKGYHLHSVRGR